MGVEGIPEPTIRPTVRVISVSDSETQEVWLASVGGGGMSTSFDGEGLREMLPNPNCQCLMAQEKEVGRERNRERGGEREGRLVALAVSLSSKSSQH